MKCKFVINPDTSDITLIVMNRSRGIGVDWKDLQHLTSLVVIVEWILLKGDTYK